MPKMSKDFPSQLSLSVTHEMRQQLVSIGYLMGSGGQYAASVRNLLQDAIYRYISELPDKKRTEFDQILANVKAREII